MRSGRGLAVIGTAVCLIYMFMSLPAQSSGDRDSADSLSFGGSSDAGRDTTDRLWIDTGRFVSLGLLEEAIGSLGEGLWSQYVIPDGVGAGSGTDEETSGRIRCMTLPHHGPAGGLVAYMLDRVAAQDMTCGPVILIGPNHGSTGPAVSVTRASWATPYGSVRPAEAIIDELIAGGLALEDTGEFEKEHSIGFIMPWLARYLPGAEVVPLIFHYRYPLEELESLFDTLSPWLEQDALLILSVDFSHNHNRDDAAALDGQTLALLEANDWRAIAGLSSDHLDSPTLMAALIRDSLARGLEGPFIMAHTNTGYLAGTGDQEITSYILLTYMEK